MLLGILQMVTELPRIGVRLSHFGSGIAFGRRQRCAEHDQEVHFTLGTHRCRRQRLEQRHPLTEMSNRFQMCGALGSSLSRLVPIVDRLCVKTCLRVMVRQQLWLCFSSLGKL